MRGAKPMITRFYAGIGSRRTPANICELMQQLGQKLALKGMILRSGAAEGADKAFENGCDRVCGKAQIFLAKSWYSFGAKFANHNYCYSDELWEKAAQITAQHHSSYLYLKPYTKRLHTRNCFQVLGWNLQEPAEFVLCWTADGARTAAETSKDTGGTGQAIRIASNYGIRVYNFAVKEDLDLAQSWID